VITPGATGVASGKGESCDGKKGTGCNGKESNELGHKLELFWMIVLDP
jgi:hypothetical protein